MFLKPQQVGWPHGGRARRWLALAALAVGIPLATAGDASALGQISYGGCISKDGSGGLCGPASESALKGADAVAISPDGRTAYVAAREGDAVAVLDRAPGGQLTYAGCVSDGGSAGACGDVPANALDGVTSLEVSPDGRSVYAGSANSDTIAVFDRAAGGQLTYAGCVSNNGSGGQCADPTGAPLASPSAISVSPDGKQAYVSVVDGVTVFDRAGGGQLTYAGCVSNTGSGGNCADAPGTPMTSATDLAVDGGGRSVYVIGSNGTITVLNRAAGGQLTYADCVSDDGTTGLCADVPGEPLTTPSGIAISPDDNTVYVTSLSRATVTVLDRASSGQIAYAGCVSDDGSGGLCADAPGQPLSKATAVTVSPDGGSVYTAGFEDTVAAFDRAPGGQITYAGCVSDTGSGGLCADAAGTPLSGATSVAVSPDDGSVYVTGSAANAIAHFFRKSAPQTAIASGPAEGSATANRQPGFTFSADQSGATFQCSVDGGTFAGCPTPFAPSALADGSHELAVRAVTGGDTDPTPALRAFRVDATGPSVRIVKAPKAKKRSAKRKPRVRFAFVASEPGATFRCKLDRRAFKACGSPKRFKVGRGKHRFVVKARDSLGNTGAAVKRTFRVVKKTHRRARR
jgi:DNA-binding beta-propeller fold protein YncE